MGKLSAMGQPTGITQPSIPRESENAFTWVTGVEGPLKRQTRNRYGCMDAGQSP